MTRYRHLDDDVTLGHRQDGTPFTLSREDMRGRIVISGGRDEHRKAVLLALVSAIVQAGGGCVHVEGGGTETPHALLAGVAELHGRSDDLLIARPSNGADGRSGDPTSTNSIDPFAVCSADDLVALIHGLFDNTASDGTMWKSRARVLLTGLMRSLVWLRENAGRALDPEAVSTGTSLRSLIDLADPTRRPEIPPSIRKSIRSYLTSLPGYKEEKGTAQAQVTLDQHEWLRSMIQNTVDRLHRGHGPVFDGSRPEIVMSDVASRRRLLSIDAASDDFAAVAIGSLAATAWNEKTRPDSVASDARRDRPKTPFVVVMDECGHLAAQGAAIMADRLSPYGCGFVFVDPAMEQDATTKVAETASRTPEIRIEVLQADADGDMTIRIDRGGDLESRNAEVLVRSRQHPVVHVRPLDFVSWRNDPGVVRRFHDRHDTVAASIDALEALDRFLPTMHLEPLRFVGPRSAKAMLFGDTASTMQRCFALTAGYRKLRSACEAQSTDQDDLVRLKGAGR